MHGRAAAFLFTMLLLITVRAYPQELYAAKDGSIRNVDSRAMIADKGTLYLATRFEVYAAGDAQDRWRPVFSLPSGENEITSIGRSSGGVLIGTKRGIYMSGDAGKTWRNVFRTILPEKSNILSIEVSRRDPKKAMIGTGKGVFLSDDGGARWRNISGILKNRRIGCIAIDSGYIYAGSDDGLYISKDSPYAWEKIYGDPSGVGGPDEIADESGDSVEAEETLVGGIACIAIKGKRLFAGAGKRIVYSDDRGKAWARVSTDGLAGSVKCILVSAGTDRLHCATSKGVYAFLPEKKKWSELYRGFEKTLSVNSLVYASADEASLWALTEKGLYRLESGNFIENQYIDVEKNLKSLEIVYNSEPDIGELQRAALRFNEVDPEKIKKWRSEARLKALVPKVSVGFDNSRSNSYEIYTSATKDYVVGGPDDISEGIDVSVSWDLGNMIWSDDQTNIDVRSRLTTQLRNDILDDLRRVYFERKRLQFESVAFPPKDMKARFEKQLRIQELTQAIDDLTGNYLSEHVKRSPESTVHSPQSM